MKDFEGLTYSIKVCKQYLNFSAAHFLIFADGSREPLHGHNYQVKFEGDAAELDRSDMVFDFLDIKPLIKKVCDTLDHRLLLPESNEQLTLETNETQLIAKVSDGSEFQFPRQDVLILPLHNISAESLAAYLWTEIYNAIKQQFNFSFNSMSVEVEETSGQSAVVKKEL